MPRTKQQLTYNSFSGGIVTEASPLTFPDGASIDEQNFELTKQGFRKRRLGIDFISSLQDVTVTGIQPKDIKTYLWENVGTTGKSYLVVGVKSDVLIYNITDTIAGDSLVFRSAVSIANDTTLSFTSRLGELVVASGADTVTVIRALGDDLFAERKERLRIRDRVGLPVYIKDNGTSTPKIDLRTAEKAGLRPTDAQLMKSGTASTRTVTFSSVVKLTDNVLQTDATRLTRYKLVPNAPYYSFQGYPLESITIEQKTLEGVIQSNRIHVVFKDMFPRSSIGINLAAGSLTVSDGVYYSASLTTTEFNNLLAVPSSITLTESLAGYSPYDYNLWNQGWGESRMIASGSTALIRPITTFKTASGGLNPSMADTVTYGLYPDSADDTNRTADRFHPEDLVANPPGTLPAPRGKYVIDAINRGTSRSTQWANDLAAKGETSTGTYFNFEKTSVGARNVASYAGRIWYGGFSGDSPGSTLTLSDKILYSQVADAGLYNCYQESDPTSKEDYELIDTDGGWVSIDDIDRVVELLVVDSSLLVFGNNGVWAISGIDGNTFSPTSSLVTKITEKGAVNPQSIVVVDSQVIFWAEDGIYKITGTGFSEFAIESLTKGTINDLVISLTDMNFKNMSGAYDERLERIVWLIDTATDGKRRELVYHMLFGSFTLNVYNNYINGSKSINLLGMVRLPLFETTDFDLNVVISSGSVFVGTDTVVASSGEKSGKFSRIAYIASDDVIGSGVKIGFADLVRTDFKDWGQVDAEGYLVTGYVSGGDTARSKSVSSLTCHFNKTEGNATVTGAEGESSCLIQSQWDWTNNAFSNKWSNPFQAYRLQRPQIRGLDEPVAEGINVVTTKSKLRGRGNVLSLKFSTEEGKDCQILGWSMIAGVNNNV